MTKIQLRDYQILTVDKVNKALFKHKHVLLVSSQGSGKCLAKGTGVLMYDGSVKLVEDVVAGDVLMGDDSTPRNVLSTSIGREEMFTVIPTKGSPFTCNKSHILSLEYSGAEIRSNAKRILNISVYEYLKWNKSIKARYMLYRRGVEFSHKDTLLDPWLVGIWLADGSKTSGNPYIYVNSNDLEILTELSKYNPLITDDNERGTCKKVSFTDKSNGCTKNLFRDEFRRCLYNSDHRDVFIPDDYKVNSRSNRLRLLAGIIDGDGHLLNNGIEVSTKFSRLRDDILFLCRSLGMAAYYSVKRVNDGVYYRISISGNTDEIPNVLQRKRASERRQIKSVLRTGFTIESAGVGDYYGFEIDGNSLFLLSDFTVTHNTFMFSDIAKKAIAKGRNVLILSNRTKLLKQTDGALKKFGIFADFITNGYNKIPTSKCVVATSQTLLRRYLKPEYQEYLKSVDLLIIDEAHGQDFNFILECDVFRNKWVTGVTATPFRSGKQRQFGLDYFHIVEGLSFADGIKRGVLSPPRYFVRDAPDLSDVGVDAKSGDYFENDMYRKYDRPERYNGLITAFKEICDNEKTICFCCNQIHAIKTCLEFIEAGVSAKFLTSGIAKSHEDYHIFEQNNHLTGDEDTILDEFRDGKFTVLVNVAKYIAGFDEPSIVNVIFNRATMSKSLWGQAGCRGSRIFEGKKFFRVLDFGDNLARHGAFESECEYGLWHDYKPGAGIAMTKECPECRRLIHIGMPKCPFCGHVFATKKELREIELREIINGEFELKNMTADQLKAYAELKGYHKNWVFRQLYIGGGDAGLKKGMRELGYENKFIYNTLRRIKS